ncbi:hypothetical protein [Burkholderia glumae]|uniref:hypothetical protein n=1 Tax=Burkholderia glumae TaxID=337 RepID=UPI002150D431|nr:hypothetical protein [Burkholderia glumae]
MKRNENIAETWRVTVWGIGLNTFLVDVYGDRKWRLTRGNSWCLLNAWPGIC